MYGGTERVVSWLTEQLVEMGHDVTLFASGDSITDAVLEACAPCALRLDSENRDPMLVYGAMLARLAQLVAEFDVVHSHIGWIHIPLLQRLGIPFVTTLHGRLDLPDLPHCFDACFSTAPFVSISDAQRAPLPQARWAGTVHHGLPVNLLKPNFSPRGYLAFLGRIAPEKGPDVAVRIARAAGLPLKIAAKVDKQDEAYFEAEIKQLFKSDLVEFVGEITESEKASFLGNAAALLFPIRWPEPFGLVMIEALACGTPVIAYRRGSVPEIIDHGVTGFIVENEEEAVEAVRRVDQLDRRRLRSTFETRFSAERMARDYLQVYERVVAAGQSQIDDGKLAHA
jgi:glycosyltransferase involved in cell wall biosynthesis